MLLAAGGAAVWGVRRFLGLDQSEFDDWTPPPVEPTPGTSTGSTDVDASLLEILACPDDKQPVVKIDDKIVCTQCGKRYPIRDGIPVMLIDEAEEGPPPTEEEVAAARAALKGEQAEASGDTGETASEAEESSADEGSEDQAAEGEERKDS
ncbi:MAG: hypothetical protein CL878_00125 [Dehalococcoidia bacterium]|nr:hypothetical protein [Dehalococcoidia bacterium]